MRDPISHSIRSDAGANAAKYGLIVAAITLAILTVMLGIGSSLSVTIGHVESVLR